MFDLHSQYSQSSVRLPQSLLLRCCKLLDPVGHCTSVCEEPVGGRVIAIGDTFPLSFFLFSPSCQEAVGGMLKLLIAIGDTYSFDTSDDETFTFTPSNILTLDTIMGTCYFVKNSVWATYCAKTITFGKV